MLRPEGPLRGARVLVTAGPTFEDLDPVRFIGNRSSGRMGYAIAAEAVRRGAHVALVTGPTAIEPPDVADIVRVRSAVEMHRAVLDRADRADVVIMAAAVADYAPADPVDQKISKTGDTLTVSLKRNPDILEDLGRRRLATGRSPILIGFAAETEDVVARARAKRERKHAGEEEQRQHHGSEVGGGRQASIDGSARHDRGHRDHRQG